MSYSKRRTDYNNQWPNSIIEFEGETKFKNLLSEKATPQILLPISLPLIEDDQFQRILSFKIDIFDQLPIRPDIAFDLAWRTFESYSVFCSIRASWSARKTYKILHKVCEDILERQVSANCSIGHALENLMSAIPLQATEFLAKRLIGITTGRLISQQAYIRERVEESVGKDFVDYLDDKYLPLIPQNQRNAGRLIQKAMAGEEVFIGGRKMKWTILQRLKFLINGILYSYRNERFHGDSFSPFKSSQTTLKTYSHSYYCLLATYFFITQMTYYHFPTDINMDDMAKKLDENTSRFLFVFNKHIKK